MRMFQFKAVVVSLVAVLFLLFASVLEASDQPKQANVEPLPVIDIHAHIFHFGDDPTGDPQLFWGMPHWSTGRKASENVQAYFDECYALFRKHNVTAVVSSTPELVEKWKSQDEDNRIIPALLMFSPTSWEMTAERFEALVKSGKIKVFGEIGPLYTGGTLCDPGWKPYLAVCEKYDVPVSLHTGSGVPAKKDTWRDKARQRFGDPYLIEDVLVEYPNLRINFCHHGFEHHEHALQLMILYPSVYADLGAMALGPTAKRLAKEFLSNAKHAGVLDRVMFGSDIVLWPHYLETTLDYFDSLDFLTETERRDILYNNAVKFLKLDQ